MRIFFFIFGNFSKEYQTHINRTNLFTSQGFFCSIWGSALKTYRFKISMKIIYQSRTTTRVNEKLSFAPPMFNRERGRRRGGGEGGGSHTARNDEFQVCDM